MEKICEEVRSGFLCANFKWSYTGNFQMLQKY